MKLRAIFNAFLGATIVVGLSACTPLEPNAVPLGSALMSSVGVIGYWAFDETALGTAPDGADFADSSGYGHHGKAIGTLELGTTGIKGKAVTSTGAGSIVIPIDLSHDSVVSVSMWVNPHISGAQTTNTLFEYTPDSSISNGFFASLNDSSGSLANALLMRMHGSAGFFGQEFTTPLNSIWHNILIVYDQSNPSQNTITLSLDGVLVSTTVNAGQTANNSGNFDNSSLYLLCHGGTSLCLNADIDELILFNRAITLQELNSLYPN